MAVLAACRFATDVTVLADYLSRKEAGDNVTLELTSADKLMVLDWGNDLISTIVQYVTNFFILLQEEGIAYFCTTPPVPFHDRLALLFADDYKKMVDSCDGWIQQLWLANQPHKIRFPILEKMTEQERLNHFSLHALHLRMIESTIKDDERDVEEAEQGLPVGDERQAFLTYMVGFQIVHKVLDEQQGTMPENYPKLLQAELPLGGLHAKTIVTAIETCANICEELVAVLQKIKTIRLRPKDFETLTQVLHGELIVRDSGTMVKATLKRDGTGELPGLMFEEP